MACSSKGMQTVSLDSNANSLPRAHYSKQTEKLNTTGNMHMSSGMPPQEAPFMIAKSRRFFFFVTINMMIMQEAPVLGAWGLGWEVWCDGQEITQFTYFQQAGGVPLAHPAIEITYGLERILMALQVGTASLFSLIALLASHMTATFQEHALSSCLHHSLTTDYVMQLMYFPA